MDGGNTHICVRLSDGAVRCICDGKGYDWDFSVDDLTQGSWYEGYEKFYAERSDARVCGYGDTVPRASGSGAWPGDGGAPPAVNLAGPAGWVAAGGTATCAVMAGDGSIKCW